MLLRHNDVYFPFTGPPYDFMSVAFPMRENGSHGLRVASRIEAEIPSFSAPGKILRRQLNVLDEWKNEFVKTVYLTSKHWWSSGMMNRCHRFDPGSIPGRCIAFYFFLWRKEVYFIYSCFFLVIGRSDCSTFNARTQIVIRLEKIQEVACFLILYELDRKKGVQARLLKVEQHKVQTNFRLASFGSREADKMAVITLG